MVRVGAGEPPSFPAQGPGYQTRAVAAAPTNANAPGTGNRGPTPEVSRYASPQPQAEPPLTTPADRRVLTASLPPLQDADARAIEAFIDAIWAEIGLARQTMDSDRRDLAGHAPQRRGAPGGLRGAGRAGVFGYEARPTRHGHAARRNGRPTYDETACSGRCAR